MANLGTISVVVDKYKTGSSIPKAQTGAAVVTRDSTAYGFGLAPWDETGNIFRQAGTAQIAGTVSQSGVPVPHCMVRLYYRPTGALIASALTSASGSFAFKDLAVSSTKKYLAVAFSPDGGVQYNAIVFDLLTPA